MWEAEFFPRGIKYNKAKIIWGGDVPETVLKTVRLKVTCRNELHNERFKVKLCFIQIFFNKNYFLTDICVDNRS